MAFTAKCWTFPAPSRVLTRWHARRMLAGALVDVAETSLLQGEQLPTPDPSATDNESDLEEPIHLILTAASNVRVVPEPEYETV